MSSFFRRIIESIAVRTPRRTASPGAASEIHLSAHHKPGLEIPSVGVVGWYGGSIVQTLKRYSLLYDSVVVDHVHSQAECRDFSCTDEGKQTLSAIEWLEAYRVIIHNPEPGLEEANVADLDLSDSEKEILQELSEARSRHRRQALRGLLEAESKPHVPQPNGFRAKDLYIRLLASRLQSKHGLDAVPVLDSLELPPRIQPAARAEVMYIVLQRIPSPSELTPWEAVLDYRLDEEARRKYARLRVWINRMSRGGMSAAEVCDTLNELCAEYEAYMAVQHKKLALDRLDKVASAPLETIENILKLKLSKLFRPFVDLQRVNLSYIESELKAPGKEVAYLADVTQRFGQHRI